MKSTTVWRSSSGAFGGWEREGTSLVEDGTIHLDAFAALSGADPYLPGEYRGGDFYNGGDFTYGRAIGPVVEPGFPFTHAVASWNVDTPPGTWIEAMLRSRVGERWTKWYSMGVWAAGSPPVRRHSVDDQRDEDGSVETDVLALGSGGKGDKATAVQLKLRLFTATAGLSPSLRLAAVAVNSGPAEPPTLTPGNGRLWGQVLDVPRCSQRVYADGGEAWCSPTSIAMILACWAADATPCEARVRHAVEGVYDRVYDGHGNWPFNTAYAATQGLESYVTNFASLAEAEEWIAAGVPVAISYAWSQGELAGAPVPSSKGHLAVLVGFDETGNPVVNDPAAPDDASVRRVYSRRELESLWLRHSAGTVYLAYPPGHPVPTRNSEPELLPR